MQHSISLIVFLLGSHGLAAAQSMTPMKAEVVTFADRGNIALDLRNPYEMPKRFSIDAYNLDGTYAEDVQTIRRSVSLAPGGTAKLYFFIPQMAGSAFREVYVCATSDVAYGRGTGMRGRVCGKYRVHYRSL